MARFFRLFFISSALVSLAACTHKSDENPNTLHLYEPEKITSLDPAHANDLYSHTEVSRVYEGLVQYHYLKRPFVLIPQLIDAMPALSADGKTYTFKIKKGVLFQDDPCFKETAGKGRELTAEDFVYSFKRIGDPATISSGWWIFDGKIAGFNEWHDQSAKVGTTDYAAKIEGLQATDRYTLQIKLTARSNQFLFNLAQSFASVVAKEAVDFYGAQFQNHPVGTGPFRLVEFNPNARMIYARNPTFHGENYPTEGEPGDKEKGYLEDAGKPLPFVDRVEVRVFIEDQPRWLTFMKGDLDYIVIPKDNYGQAFKDGKMAPELLAKGIREQRYPMLDITHLSFNMIDPVLGKNKLLRQALSIVYDQKKVNALFYNGLALEAQGPIPPGLSGYDPNFKDPYRQTNVEKAKELLAKAGYPDGKGLAPLEYLTQSGTTMRQWSEYDEKQFAQIGRSSTPACATARARSTLSPGARITRMRRTSCSSSTARTPRPARTTRTTRIPSTTGCTRSRCSSPTSRNGPRSTSRWSPSSTRTVRGSSRATASASPSSTRGSRTTSTTRSSSTSRSTCASIDR
jgi:oligopeptide transport system substrate-binding protein